MLLWLIVIVMKMIGKVFKLKKDLTWIRKTEVTIWSIIILIRVIMIIVMIIVAIICHAMLR